MAPSSLTETSGFRFVRMLRFRRRPLRMVGWKEVPVVNASANQPLLPPILLPNHQPETCCAGRACMFSCYQFLTYDRLLILGAARLVQLTVLFSEARNGSWDRGQQICVVLGAACSHLVMNLNNIPYSKCKQLSVES